MFDLKSIGAWLMENKLMDKPFSQFDEGQIVGLCQKVVESITNPAVTAPAIVNDVLILGPTVPQKYKWWAGGQSILKTLEEMGAPAHIIEKYCPARDREGMKKG